MKKSTFPFIAVIVGSVLLAVLISIDTANNELAVPILMLLFMSELGFFVTAAGAFVGVKLQMDSGFQWKLSLITVACLVMAGMLGFKGFELWGMVSP